MMKIPTMSSTGGNFGPINIEEMKKKYAQGRVQNISAATALILTYLIETGLQLYVTVVACNSFLGRTSEWSWVLGGSLVFSSLFVSAISLVWVWQSLDFAGRLIGKLLCYVMHSLLLGLVWRYLKLAFAYDPADVQEFVALRIFQTYIQSLPLTSLHLAWLLAFRENWTSFNLWIIFAEALSIITALFIATYVKSPPSKNSQLKISKISSDNKLAQSCSSLGEDCKNEDDLKRVRTTKFFLKTLKCSEISERDDENVLWCTVLSIELNIVSRALLLISRLFLISFFLASFPIWASFLFPTLHITLITIWIYFREKWRKNEVLIEIKSALECSYVLFWDVTSTLSLEINLLTWLLPLFLTLCENSALLAFFYFFEKGRTFSTVLVLGAAASFLIGSILFFGLNFIKRSSDESENSTIFENREQKRASSQIFYSPPSVDSGVIVIRTSSNVSMSSAANEGLSHYSNIRTLLNEKMPERRDLISSGAWAPDTCCNDSNGSSNSRNTNTLVDQVKKSKKLKNKFSSTPPTPTPHFNFKTRSQVPNFDLITLPSLHQNAPKRERELKLTNKNANSLYSSSCSSSNSNFSELDLENIPSLEFDYRANYLPHLRQNQSFIPTNSKSYYPQKYSDVDFYDAQSTDSFYYLNESRSHSRRRNHKICEERNKCLSKKSGYCSDLSRRENKFLFQNSNRCNEPTFVRVDEKNKEIASAQIKKASRVIMNYESNNSSKKSKARCNCSNSNFRRRKEKEDPYETLLGDSYKILFSSPEIHSISSSQNPLRVLCAKCLGNHDPLLTLCDHLKIASNDETSSKNSIPEEESTRKSIEITKTRKNTNSLDPQNRVQINTPPLHLPHVLNSNFTPQELWCLEKSGKNEENYNDDDDETEYPSDPESIYENYEIYKTWPQSWASSAHASTKKEFTSLEYVRAWLLATQLKKGTGKKGLKRIQKSPCKSVRKRFIKSREIGKLSIKSSSSIYEEILNCEKIRPNNNLSKNNLKDEDEGDDERILGDDFSLKKKLNEEDERSMKKSQLEIFEESYYKDIEIVV